MKRARYGDGVLGGQSEDEHRRLVAMAAVCDPATRDLLSGLGLRSGWRCWEVGAGAGTVATWLASVVGPTGEVLATDIAAAVVQRLPAPGVRALRHDVVRDPLPARQFDLIHARFVLEHLPDRDRVLRRLVRALAPGGVLVVEALADFPLRSGCGAFDVAMRAVERVLAETIGTDSGWARDLPLHLSECGLTDVGIQAQVPTTGGRNASALCWVLTLRSLRPSILTGNHARASEVDTALALLEDPGFLGLGFATIAGWGRKVS